MYACPVQSVQLHTHDTFSSSSSLLVFLRAWIYLLLLAVIIVNSFNEIFYEILFSFNVKSESERDHQNNRESNHFEVKNEYVKLILKVLITILFLSCEYVCAHVFVMHMYVFVLFFSCLLFSLCPLSLSNLSIVFA